MARFINWVLVDNSGGVIFLFMKMDFRSHSIFSVLVKVLYIEGHTSRCCICGTYLENTGPRTITRRLAKLSVLHPSLIDLGPSKHALYSWERYPPSPVKLDCNRANRHGDKDRKDQV